MAELNSRLIAKASGVTGEAPLAVGLEVAELAVNTADGILFTKHTDGSIVTITGGGGGGGMNDLVDDTSPQLGGDLDVNGYYIASTNSNVSLAPSSGELVVRGGASEGRLTLNCTANTHGVSIQSPPHSAAATYTLTLPNDAGTSGQVLSTDGAGGLSWTDSTGSSGTALPSVGGWSIDSGSAAATSFDLDAPDHSAGELIVACIVSRDGGGSLTPPSGFTLYGEYLNSIQFSGDSQTISVFTKVATDSEPVTYTWTQASSSRICGLAAAITAGASIDSVVESYGNADTATANVSDTFLNLTVATWIYSASSGTEGYSQSGPGVVEITDSPREQARISGGYTKSPGIVTSTHEAAEAAGDPNHGMIVIRLASGAPPTVNSVNGETGVVSLGIQDMDDYEPQYLGFSSVVYTKTDYTNPGGATPVTQGASKMIWMNEFDQNGTDIDDFLASFVNNDPVWYRTPYTDGWLAVTATRTSPGGQNRGLANSDIYFALAALSGAEEIEISLLDPEALTPAPLSEGDIMQWNDIESKFKPTSDYISLTTLKAEVAAAADFADFQTRIAAL